jgi:tetratricopeptide (TPR) repeat protein
VVTALLLSIAITGLAPQDAHDIEREYHRRIRAADADTSTAEDRYLAAEAARYMRRFDEARFYLGIAEMAAETEGDRNGILSEKLWLELATGGGVAGVRQVFAQERRQRDIPPVVTAGWVNAFPELLIGGEFDELIDSLAEHAADERYRCACYAPKAWMHRAAGRMDRSRGYWDSLTVAWQRVPDFADPFNEADWRAQLARNYARAGHFEDSQAELERAMTVDVSAFESVFIRRRRAQTYAELGDVEKAVADLEYLLSVPSPVTVHTLATRLTWSGVRDHPLFRALLKRQRLDDRMLRQPDPQ